MLQSGNRQWTEHVHISFLVQSCIVFTHTYTYIDTHIHTVYTHIYMFLMRDEKEERKKQARSNKQTRQSNTAHMYM